MMKTYCNFTKKSDGSEVIDRYSGIIFLKKLRVFDLHNFLSPYFNTVLSKTEIFEINDRLEHSKDNSLISFEFIDKNIIPFVTLKNFGSSWKYLRFYPLGGVEGSFKNRKDLKSKEHPLSFKWIHPEYYYYKIPGNIVLEDRNSFKFTELWKPYNFPHILPRIDNDKFFDCILNDVINQSFLDSRRAIWRSYYSKFTFLSLYISRKIGLL